MTKSKKDCYKDFLRCFTQPNYVNRASRGNFCEKGGRLVCKKLEASGYLKFQQKIERKDMFLLTEKGRELLNNLNDFEYKFNDRELFK